MILVLRTLAVATRRQKVRQPLQCIKCLYKCTKLGGDEKEELDCREGALCWLALLILRKSQGEERENDFA